MQFLFLGIVAVFTLVGLLGIVIPALPDAAIILLGILIYAIWDKFQNVSFSLIAVFIGLSILSYLLDYLATLIGAKKLGASKWGILGAVLGGIIGFLIANVLGLVLGSIALAVILEATLARKDLKAAFKIGFGAFLGFLFGFFGKIIIAIIMIALFLRAVF